MHVDVGWEDGGFTLKPAKWLFRLYCRYNESSIDSSKYGPCIHSCKTWNYTFHAGRMTLILLKPGNVLRLTIKFWTFSMAVLLIHVIQLTRYYCFGTISIDLSDQWAKGLLTFRTNDPSDCWLFGPLTLRTNDITLHVGVSTFRTNDPSDYRPLGPMILRTVDH